MQTWQVPVGSEMCGGDSNRVMDTCADGHREKTTPLGKSFGNLGDFDCKMHMDTDIQTQNAARVY